MSDHGDDGSTADSAGGPPGSVQPTSLLRRVSFWLAPSLALCAFLLAFIPESPPIPRDPLIVLGVTFWMAIWWLSETVPIGATSMIPMAVFPLLGVTPAKEIVRPYMNPFIVLLMAGFMAALAIERWNLHRRLALGVLVRVGTSPRGLLAGMMIATAICSMWISNTASTLIMLPIAMALLSRLDEGATTPAARAGVVRFGTVLFLGVAYSASIGGIGTPIGTPPNLIFMSVYKGQFGIEPSFVDWLGWGLPVVVIGLPIVFVMLAYGRRPLPTSLGSNNADHLRSELRGLGRMSADERAVAGIFLGMVVLWVTRQIRVGEELVGWAPWLGIEKYVHDSTVAVVGVLLMFAWPSRTKRGDRLLDWDTAKRIPWDVVLLFGGGVALAVAFKDSGLSELISQQLTGLSELHEVWMILIIALTVTFLTEVTSNTATTTLLMPVLATFAAASGLAPEKVMLPAAISASCAFMLPVATAPNAIVYGSGRVSIRDMAREGFRLNLVMALVVTTLAWLVF